MASETETLTLDAEVLSEGVRAVFDSSGKGFYVIAEVNGKAVGGLMITCEWSDWRNAWWWWIQSVYVLSEYRKRHRHGRRAQPRIPQARHLPRAARVG
jgi:hypothetical protein